MTADIAEPASRPQVTHSLSLAPLVHPHSITQGLPIQDQELPKGANFVEMKGSLACLLISLGGDKTPSIALTSRNLGSLSPEVNFGKLSGRARVASETLHHYTMVSAEVRE